MTVSSINNTTLVNNNINTESKTPVINKPETTAPTPANKPASDKFNVNNEKAVSTTTKQAIKSNLQIDVTDNDGLTVMGKSDITAKISGDISVTPEFILGKLSEMKSNESKKFYPPKFDAERKQYIISGKAIDAILGMINVGFEIRLGEFNGKLAFQVDSGIKRGSIYGDLEKMMKELGIETYKEDKLLYIKPSYKDVIDIPISKEKNQKARIESLDTNQTNTKFSIDKSGLVTVKLKDVKVVASTDPNATANTKLAKPDVASVKFDFSMDNTLKPTVNIKDGNIQTTANQKILEKYLGKETTAQVDHAIGTSMSVSLSKLSGKVKVDESGIDADVKTDLNVQSNTDDSKISGGVKVNLNNNKPVVEVNNLDASLKNGQKVNAQTVKYDGRKEGLDIKADGVTAHVNQQGINADIKGDVKVSKQGTATNITLNGDVTGKADKQDLKADVETHGVHTVKIAGKNISVGLDGTAKGKIAQEQINAEFNTQGKHDVDVEGNKINVTIDQMMAIGSFNKTATKKPATASTTTPDININVKKADVTGKADLGDIKIEGSLKEGGVKVGIGKSVHIETDAQVSAKADGSTVKAKADLKGAKVDIKEDGNIDIKAEQVQAEGGFKNKNKLGVEGKVTGNVGVKVGKNGDIEVSTTQGTFDAKFRKGDKIKVDGKGTDANFKINKNEDIKVELTNVEAKTDIAAGNVRVSANTKGEKATVETKGDNVSVVTKNTKSYAEVKVKQTISVKGTTGDVNVKVNSTKNGDDVKIDAKNADMKADIKNNNGKLNVNAHTKADVSVKVTSGKTSDDVSISTKNAKMTEAKLNLNNKVAVDANGKNFNVDIKGDDIGIKVKDAQFTGKVTPNKNITVNAASQTKADVNVSISDKEISEIKVDTKAAIKGDVNIKDKVKSDFNNKNGFSVKVTDTPTTSQVKTSVQGLNLKGQVDAGAAKLGMGGDGNFDITIDDTPDTSVVSVNYDGKLKGDADIKDAGKGNYDVNGKLKIKIDGDNVNVTADGSVNAQAKSDKFGVGANVNVNGNDKNKINVNINSANETSIDLNIANEGFVEVQDIKQLKLGKEDPTVNLILSKLQSNNAKISYQNLDIKDNAQKVRVNVQTSEIKTAYGNVQTAMAIRKDGARINIDKGVAVIEPNAALFKFVTDELSSKYKIKVTGTPEFKNGTLSIQGEIKTKTGVVQLANFNIKTTVVNDNLVLDIDDAKVLKIIGENTLSKVLNKVLNKTDIEHVKLDKNSITIKLGDIFKDLATTEGVNFTGVKLENNKIKVGFVYNSLDQDVAKLSKAKDVTGVDRFLKDNKLTSLSGEAISTAYSVYATAGDVDRASNMMVNVAKSYADPNQGNKTEIGRGLTWISKNQGVKKKNVEDDISLKFAQTIDLKSAHGQNIIKSLPLEVVKNLTDNLDKTISQGGGMSLITPAERDAANAMRRLKGLAENKARF